MDKGLLEVIDILNEYSKDIQEGITTKAEEVAKQSSNELKNTKNTYQVRTGKYNRGWRVKTTKGTGYVECIVHNATNYQLTHLLEKGHDLVGRNGQHKGTTRAFTHIAPVEAKAVRQYESDVENIIKNGG